MKYELETGLGLSWFLVADHQARCWRCWFVWLLTRRVRLWMLCLVGRRAVVGSMREWYRRTYGMELEVRE